MVAAYVVSVAGSSIVHSLGDMSPLERLPCSIVSPFRLIVASVWVKMAVHSESHSFPMLSKCVYPNAGKISVLVASGGRWGKCR